PLAYQNEPFLSSPDGRILRIMSEYVEPLARFRREQIQDTVVFFGSARFINRRDAQKTLTGIEGDAKDQGSGQGNELKRALAAVDMARYYEDARRLAYLLTDWPTKIPPPRRRFGVITEGGRGTMEPATLAAKGAGGKQMGWTTTRPFE